MKKLILSVITLFAVSTIMNAQDFAKNIIGVRVGFNNTGFHVSQGGKSTNTDSNNSFMIGVVDQYRLIEKPLYLEFGLIYNGKGAKLSASKFDLEKDESIHLAYLEVPVLISYHIGLSQNWMLEPSLGGYVAYGIAGDFKDNDIERFDTGARVQIGATYKRFHANVNYDFGFANIAKKNDDGIKGRNLAIGLTLGYNF